MMRGEGYKKAEHPAMAQVGMLNFRSILRQLYVNSDVRWHW